MLSSIVRLFNLNNHKALKKLADFFEGKEMEYTIKNKKTKIKVENKFMYLRELYINLRDHKDQFVYFCKTEKDTEILYLRYNSYHCSVYNATIESHIIGDENPTRVISSLPQDKRPPQNKIIFVTQTQTQTQTQKQTQTQTQTQTQNEKTYPILSSKSKKFSRVNHGETTIEMLSKNSKYE